ncbi:hypothetical protein EVAR_16329_1 [Eumeta japonica]|uniref:Uncharacterized protein n=1 Tax=Eumeta variegata TaxID=151549 RepID=A0A4C1VHL2_EUMVA|nr:hypothetical protein EVAR_16329_1 [Eumeta japonica]
MDSKTAGLISVQFSGNHQVVNAAHGYSSTDESPVLCRLLAQKQDIRRRKEWANGERVGLVAPWEPCGRKTRLIYYTTAHFSSPYVTSLRVRACNFSSRSRFVNELECPLAEEREYGGGGVQRTSAETAETDTFFPSISYAAHDFNLIAVLGINETMLVQVGRQELASLSPPVENPISRSSVTKDARLLLFCVYEERTEGWTGDVGLVIGSLFANFLSRNPKKTTTSVLNRTYGYWVMSYIQSVSKAVQCSECVGTLPLKLASDGVGAPATCRAGRGAGAVTGGARTNYRIRLSRAVLYLQMRKVFSLKCNHMKIIIPLRIRYNPQTTSALTGPGNIPVNSMEKFNNSSLVGTALNIAFVGRPRRGAPRLKRRQNCEKYVNSVVLICRPPTQYGRITVYALQSEIKVCRRVCLNSGVKKKRKPTQLRYNMASKQCTRLQHGDGPCGRGAGPGVLIRCICGALPPSLIRKCFCLPKDLTVDFLRHSLRAPRGSRPQKFGAGNKINYKILKRSSDVSGNAAPDNCR